MTGILSQFVPPPAGPRSPPAVAEVDVWRVALDAPPDVVSVQRRLLSPPEAARADRFQRARHRRRFTVARGALRWVLGSYLRRPPQAIELTYGERDKPRLAGPVVGHGNLQFNLSHSAELALVAVTSGAEVGIDVEAVRPLADAAELAERYFSPGERAALAACSDAERQAAFYRCWTRKEAYVKAVGDGVGLGLDRFEVSLDAGGGARFIALADAPAGASAWSLVHLEPAPGYIGALALPLRPVRVRGWQWIPPIVPAG